MYIHSRCLHYTIDGVNCIPYTSSKGEAERRSNNKRQKNNKKQTEGAMRIIIPVNRLRNLKNMTRHETSITRRIYERV